MNPISKKCTGILFLIFFFNVNSAHAESACNIACAFAEAAGEVACALEIFSEPECGLAVLAAAAKCHQLCLSDVSLQEADLPQRTTVKETGLCDGKLVPKNKKLAAKFCEIYK